MPSSAGMSEVRPTFQVPDDLPPALPVMALRRGILLPGMVSQFLVGRARSLSAVLNAHDGWLLVAAQREPTNDPAPWKKVTLFFLNRYRMPSLFCLTTASLRASRRARSRLRLPTLMPWSAK